MKELNDKVQDQVKIVGEKEEPRTIVFDPRQMHPGHTLFQIELATGIIQEVQFEQINYSLLTDSVRKKLVKQKGFEYIPALNWHNADKKFFKLLGLKYPGRVNQK